MAGRWAAGWLIRNTGGRAREGWRALPRETRRKWFMLLGIGAVALVALMKVLQMIAQRAIASGSLGWERDFLAGIEAHPPFGFSSAVWYQTLGTDITLWFLCIIMAGIIAWNRRPITALSVVLAWLGVDLVVRFSWATWNRARPDIIAQGLAAPGFASFPSGHTGKTLAVYGVLCYLWARASRSWIERILAIVIAPAFAALVGYSRIRMGVHWPTDVMAGGTIGLVWMLIIIAGIRMEERALGQSASATRDRSASASAKQRRVAR